MVRGDDEQVAVPQARQQPRQPRVEPLEIGRIAGDVVAVAVLRVEVDEVREDEARTAVAIAFSISSTPSSSLFVWTAVVTPRPAKRSWILPIAWTDLPAAVIASSSVVPAGGSA